MIEIIKTNDGYMVQHKDGKLEGEYLCDAKGNNLFDWFFEAESILENAFDKDQSLMSESKALIYYTDKLAKHGWHIPAIFSIKDVKDYINGGGDIVEMPSDEALNIVCSRVAKKYAFEDYTMCIEWAAELANEYIKEEQDD